MTPLYGIQIFLEEERDSQHVSSVQQWESW
jgi:hypothetical protein